MLANCTAANHIAYDSENTVPLSRMLTLCDVSYHTAGAR